MNQAHTAFQLLQCVLLSALLAATFYLLQAVNRPLSIATSPAPDPVWEYETIYFDSHHLTSTDDALPMSATIDEAKLREQGADGWEVCGVVPETTTAWPIVSGKDIAGGSTAATEQPNVYTSRIEVILKRKTR